VTSHLATSQASAAHRAPVIAVVIPSYRVKAHILSVIERIGEECSLIYVVDDRCPESSGQYVLDHCEDSRVRVVFHEENQGVGGAVLSGYRQAIADGATVIVKLDGDGQMDPSWIPALTTEIAMGEADYAKGDRFYDRESAVGMPAVRLFGNAVLSFLTKFSSGYWDIVDPTNGFTAIDATVAATLPHEKISKRYFFESDMLFRLGVMRARVVDIPMPAIYGDEQSGLSIRKIVGEFMAKHTLNTLKRILYTYYVRSFSVASVELLAGLLLVLFGLGFGVTTWIQNASAGLQTSSGTVMLAALPAILGFQLLLAFLAADIASVPARPIARRLSIIRRRLPGGALMGPAVTARVVPVTPRQRETGAHG
jgi:dolichol-phosphate mannosyltransferase